MGYNIHITTGDSWVYDKNPITLDDVRKIMPMLSEQFRIDETGVITSQDQTFSADFGPYLEYTDEGGRKTYVVFGEKQCPMFKYQDDKQLLALCDVAEALSAKLQGDEDEIYDRAEIEKQIAKVPSGGGDTVALLIELQKNRVGVGLCYLIAALMWLCIFLMLMYGYTEGSMREHLMQIILSVMCNALLTAVICGIGRWKLVFDGEGVTCTPIFGNVKRLNYREILRVTVGQSYVTGQRYAIYSSSGSRWVVFTDDSPSAMQALNRMRARGVRVE